MCRVTEEDVQELLATFELVATHSGEWLDQNVLTDSNDRTVLLRAITVGASGVRRGRVMLHDGESLVRIIDEVRGIAADVAQILARGPDYVRGLYEGVARLGFAMWRRCQEQGAER